MLNSHLFFSGLSTGYFLSMFGTETPGQLIYYYFVIGKSINRKQCQTFSDYSFSREDLLLF